MWKLHIRAGFGSPWVKDETHTSATLNHTFLTPLVARLSPRLSCKPLTTASGTILHATESLGRMAGK